MKNDKDLCVIKDEISKTMCNLTKKLFHKIGSGIHVMKELDDLASYEYGKLCEFLNEMGFHIEILSVEGSRDGITSVEKILEYETKHGKNNIIIAIDPIDGTRTGSLGGSRCLSIIALERSNHRYKKIDDRLSCFYLASNETSSFSEILEDSINVFDSELIRKVLLENTVSTLRRKESKDLWNRLLSREIDWSKGIEGESTFYMPNLLLHKTFFAGDGSVFLPFESDYFIGRTGVAEARIEARLWKYWNGLIVSSSKMKKYKGGEVKYLEDRIKWLHGCKQYKLFDFFEKEEIEALYQDGWNVEEIARLISKDEWAPQYEIIMIGSLTGTEDRIFKTHSDFNMIPAKIVDDKINMELWCVQNGVISRKIIECKA